MNINGKKFGIKKIYMARFATPHVGLYPFLDNYSTFSLKGAERIGKMSEVILGYGRAFNPRLTEGEGGVLPLRFPPNLFKTLKKVT